MTTDWKILGRQDLRGFDDFGIDAVLTSMQLGGIGKMQTNGHAKIKGKNGIFSVSRDNSAPHCRGNVQAAMKRAFPELRTNGATKKAKAAMTTTKSGATQEMLDCPAKDCDYKFATTEELDVHIDSEHARCKWEGCDYGPNGTAFVGMNFRSVSGHTRTRHKENKFWLANPSKAAASRAATFAAKKKAKADEETEQTNERAAVAAKQDREFEAVLAAAEPVEVASKNGHRNGHRPPGNPPLLPEQVAVPVVTVVAAEPVEPVAAVPVNADAEATLVLIRELLTSYFGEDPEVDRLRKELVHVKTQLEFVREAVGLDFGDDDSGN